MPPSSDALPLEKLGSTNARSASQGLVAGHSECEPLLSLNVVSPDYSRVIDIAMQQSRPFDDADTSGKLLHWII